MLTAPELAPLRSAVLASLASNLFNSAAEMAFVATVLKNSPRTRPATRTTEMGIHKDDLADMFVHRQLPAGFTTWAKNKSDFSSFIGPCTKAAAQKYLNGRLMGYTIGKD